MHCPYPTALETAQVLRCGQDNETCDGPVERVYVVGFAVDDDNVTEQLNAIASADGSERARFAQTADELHEQLAALLAELE
jgi:hypothetical protein